MTTTPAIAPAPPAPAVTVAPVAALPPEPQTSEPQIPKVRKFTVAEYYRMAEVRHPGSGGAGAADRGGNYRYAAAKSAARREGIIRSNRLLWGWLAADQFLVCIQTPLHLDDGSEPEPDVMLARPRADNATKRSIPLRPIPLSSSRCRTAPWNLTATAKPRSMGGPAWRKPWY